MKGLTDPLVLAEIAEILRSVAPRGRATGNSPERVFVETP
jgi:hypothetical protein